MKRLLYTTLLATIATALFAATAQAASWHVTPYSCSDIGQVVSNWGCWRYGWEARWFTWY